MSELVQTYYTQRNSRKVLDLETKINASIEFSTTETDTKQTWTNGKTIFRKVFQGTTDSDTQTDVVSGIIKLDQVIELRAHLVDTAGDHIGTEGNRGSGIVGGLNVRVNSSSVILLATPAAAQQGRSYWIIIEYTRTTA